MVLQSLKLPPDVATMVARCMKETVMHNSATSVEFRAKILTCPEAESQRCYGGATQTLTMAERAVQEQATRAAEEEEENFRRKVVAGKGKQRLA